MSQLPGSSAAFSSRSKVTAPWLAGGLRGPDPSGSRPPPRQTLRIRAERSISARSLRPLQGIQVSHQIREFVLAQPGFIRWHERRLVVANFLNVLLQVGSRVAAKVTHLYGNIIFVEPD